MGRVPYWNVSHGWLIDLLSIPALVVFAYGLYRAWTRIRQGKATVALGIPVAAAKIGPIYIRPLLSTGILGSRIFKKPFIGVAHALVLWGMVILAMGSAAVLVQVVFGLPVLGARFGRWFMGFGLDCAGIAVLAGVAYLLVKRLIPAKRLTVVKSNQAFLVVEVALIVLVVTGYLLEGLRIAHAGADPGSVIGNEVAIYLGSTGDALALHRYAWWIHGAIALSLLAYLPYSPLVHAVLAPTNAALGVPIPGPKMGVIDFASFEADDECAPTLGAAKLVDFSWKTLLDASTCLFCGRCHEACPAAQTGKSLSPKKVMVTLREYLGKGKMEDASILERVSAESIYECTTCAACMEACPVLVNAPHAILRMRQHLLMERSEIPDTLGQAHRSLEARRHPFVGASCGPNEWRKGMDVPIYEAGKTEYLLWIGCAVAYQERAHNIARAMVRILGAAGVSFGILKENRCTGDPAKQMGDELLFTEIARENMETFQSLDVTKVITMCPHCYNSFTRHYPVLGATFTVIPHPVLLRELIESRAVTLANGDDLICFHDPCYLARHNGVVSEPRSVLSSVGRVVDMPRSGRESFCCGGGGGNYWTEEKGSRINQARAKEALDTGAQTIATACPFCMLMLTDGAKKYTDRALVKDIAELVSERIDTSTAD